jgi:tetratricopeptide (TPR) repeat protein
MATGKTKQVETKSRSRILAVCRRPSCIIVVVLAATCGVGTWVVSDRISRRSWIARLPVLPDLAGVASARSEIIKRTASMARARPGSAEAVLQLAMVYHANGYYQTAVQCYERAAQVDAAEWRCLYYHALLMEDLGNADVAATLLRRVVALRESSALCWYRLGRAELKRERLAEAAEALTKAERAALAEASAHPPRQAPKWPGIADYARFELARIAFREHAYDRAERILQALLNGAADFGPARRLLGRTYQALGRVEEAEREIKHAAGVTYYVDPIDPWLEVLVDLSRDSTFLLKYAHMCESRGQFERAVALTRLAAESVPDDFDAADQFTVRSIRYGKPAEALPHVEQFLVRHPDSAAAHGSMGLVLHAIGRPNESIAEFRKAIALNPNDATFYGNAARVMAAQNRTAEAEQLLDEAIVKMPESKILFWNRAVMHQKANRLLEACADLESALAIHKSDYFIRVFLAECLTQSGQWDRAIDEYKEVLQYSPKFARGLGGLGRALIHKQRYQEALEIALRHVEASPTDPMGHLLCARAYDALGRQEAAQEHVNVARRLQPGLLR